MKASTAPAVAPAKRECAAFSRLAGDEDEDVEGEAAAAAAVVEVLMVGGDGGEGASDSLTRSPPRVVILIVDQRGVHHDDELRVRLDLDTDSLQSLSGLLFSCNSIIPPD